MYAVYLIVLVVVSAVTSCNTEYKKEVHYHTHECDPDIVPIGTLQVNVSNPTRARRARMQHSSCNQRPIEILAKNRKLDPQVLKEVTPALVAGKFVYYYYTEPNKIFYGIESVVDAIRRNMTMNLVVDDTFDFVALSLKKSSSDPKYDESFMKKSDFESSKFKTYDWVECESFFRFLAKISNSDDWTVTITNRFNSNQEFRFLQLSQGVGGFFKRSFSSHTS